MLRKQLKTGTRVRISPKWDKAHFHQGVGVGTVDGKWGKDISVDFGYIPPNAPTKYGIIVPPQYLIVTKEAPKKYKHPNSPTMEKVEAFIDNLHGSGINYKWIVEEKPTSFRASNAFQTYTEGGYEDGSADFTVVFPKGESMGEFKLEFNGNYAQRLNQKHMLRDYLEDTVAYTLDSLKLR